MNIYLDCMPCFLRQSLDAARNVTDEVGVHERIVREVLRLAADLDLKRPPPWVGALIHRRLRELIGDADPYREAKDRFNRLALSMLPELRECVEESPNPFVAATKASIAANVIDLGVRSRLSEDRAAAMLRESFLAEVHGDSAEFQRHAENAREILFLADNAGEIVIDRLLIEAIGPERVTVAVRGKAVINDATRDDARAAGLHELVRIIDNGSDAPGTILEDCSLDFLDQFHKADLIIAKGQGNFETLSEVNADIFFLLKLKCPVIAAHIGMPMGTHALVRGASQSVCPGKASVSEGIRKLP